MDLFWKIFTPLKYLCISHKQKRFVDFLLPLVISSILTVILLNLPVNVNILGDKGIVTKVNSLLQVLSGFYVAALAAIASFSSKNLDEPLKGYGVELNGNQLTRRQLLSYLFGYLAFVSYFLVLLGISLSIFTPNISLVINELSAVIISSLKFIFFLFYFTALISVFLVTLLGLFYLTEKIHEIDSKFIE